MNEEIKQAFLELLKFHPEVDMLDHKADGFVIGDEKAPFFTEAYLYNLLGKEDARTLLAYMRKLARSIGFPQEEIWRML